MWLLLMLAAHAGQPSAHVSWRGDLTRLWVRAPAGEKIAPDAPLAVRLAADGRSVSVEGWGTDMEDGLPIGDLRDLSLSGQIDVSFCTEDGSRCRAVTLALAGELPQTRRGTAVLDVSEAMPAVQQDHFPARQDASAAYDAAVVAAKASGKPVLVDFGAIWCPPCNLLSAELLHADPRPDVVGGFELVVVDVDHHSSWPLKDQFGVGGYPTMVAVTGDGREVGRLVGYPGLEPTTAWLERVSTAPSVPSEVTPRIAGSLAWSAVQGGQEEQARVWLAQAHTEPESLDFRLARMRLDPTLEDARWLTDNAPDQAMAWIFATSRLTSTADGQRAVRNAVTRSLPTATPSESADLLSIVADFAAPEEARTLYAAAAGFVRTELSGDPVEDKGHLGWLASLTEQAGDVDGGLAVLDDARAAFPDEPTFHLASARMLVRAERYGEALEASEAALDTSWDDNLLRAAALRTKALLGLGRSDEARGFVEKILSETAAPEEGVEVRTHRYRAALRKLVAAE